MDSNYISIIDLKWIEHNGGYVLKAQFKTGINKPGKFGYVSEKGLINNINNATVIQVPGGNTSNQNNIFGFTTFDFPF